MRHSAIEEYWRVFMEHKDILADPERDRESEGLVVLDALKRIDSRLYYHLGYHDSGVDLLMSAEGYLELSDTIVECLTHAPSCIRWRFRPILDSESLFGNRNSTLFPDDENGDVLFEIAKGAGDLITPRAVDFCHIFPTELAARSFASQLRAGEKSSVVPYNGVKGFQWEVCVTRRIIPTHENITSHEAELAAFASHFGGRSDGWGFLSE